MWPGGAIVFLVWLAYGAAQWKRAAGLRERLTAISGAKRRRMATLLIFGSAALLLAGLYGIALLAPNQRSLNVLQWLAVALLGLVFVHAQTLAAAMLIVDAHLGVTHADQAASTPRKPEG